MLASDLQNVLQNSDLSQYLDQQELVMLAKHNKVVSFSQDDIILQQSKISDGIYILLQGKIRIIAQILGEGRMTLEQLIPGNFFGEISYIEKIPNTTSAVADDSVLCLFISHNYMEFLRLNYPETKYKLLCVISKQVCNRLKKMHDKTVKMISDTSITSKSFFSEILHSLIVPTKLSFKELNTDIERLKKFPVFNDFNDDELNELILHSEILKVNKNCTLIHKEEKTASCYIVIHGAVQSSILYKDKAVKLSIIGPVTLFAGVACVDQNADFTITFSTCENAVLLKMNETDLIYFKKNHPPIYYKLFNCICKSLVALEKSVDKLEIRLNIENHKG